MALDLGLFKIIFFWHVKMIVRSSFTFTACPGQSCSVFVEKAKGHDVSSLTFFRSAADRERLLESLFGASGLDVEGVVVGYFSFASFIAK